MSSLLTSSEISFATGAMNNLFDTFCSQIVVHKEPIKTIVEPESESVTFGYGVNQAPHTYSYTPVSGIFSGVFSRSGPAETEIEKKLNLQYGGTNTFLKVRQDCKNFIESGSTERIDVAGAMWKVVGTPKRKIFITDIYYIYNLEEAE